MGAQGRPNSRHSDGRRRNAPVICPVRVFRVFENAPFRKELANPLSGGDASREKCGSEMQCIGDGRRGCLGVGKSIFPGVVERMVARFGLARCPYRLSAASSHPSVASWRHAGVRRHGGTGGKPSKSGSEHIKVHYYDDFFFDFFTNYSRLAGWLVVLRARARA